MTATAAGFPTAPERLQDGARRTLLAEVIAQLTDSGEAARLSNGRDFPGIVQAVDHIFEALGRQKIRDPKHLESVIRTYREGRHSKLDGEMIGLFRRWRNCVAFSTDAVSGDGPMLSTIPDMTAALVKNGELLHAALADVERVIVHGFTTFAPSQIDLVREIASGKQDVIVALDGAPEEHGAWEPPRHMAKGIEQLRKIARSEERHSPDDDPVARAACHLLPGAPDLVEPVFDDPAPDRLSVTELPDPLREVTSIARHIAARLRRHPDRAGLIAVSFANPDRYLPLVREIFPAYAIPFAADQGVPLASVPPVAFTIALLRATAGGFRRTDMEALLKSPYLVMPDAYPNPERIDTFARRAQIIGGENVDRDWIEPLRRYATSLRHDARALSVVGGGAASRRARILNEARETDRAVAALVALFGALRPLIMLRAHPTTVAGFRDAVLNLLSALGTWYRSTATVNAPNLWRAARRDVAALRRLSELMDEMTRALNLRRPDPKHRLGGWIERLRALLAEELLQPMEEEPGGVRIVGLADLRMLPTNAVFIGGLTEAQLPRRRVRELFFPETGDMARDFTLHPDPAAEDAAALYGEIARRREVHLSWPSRVDGALQLRSPLLDRLADSLRPQPLDEPEIDRPARERLIEAAVDLAADPYAIDATFAPLLEDPSASATARATLHALAVEAVRHHGGLTPYSGSVSAVAQQAAAYHPGGSHVYSVTEIETYARCPYVFFSERMLRLGELDEVEEELSPLTRGHLLHTILHRFYAQRLGRDAGPISQATLPEARREMLDIAEDELSEIPSDDLLWRATRDSICAGLRPEEDRSRRPGILAAFLEAELNRWANGWRPAALEWSFGFPDEPPVEIDTPGGTMRLRGRIDRVDEREDGVCLVLDYKTGAVPSVKDIERGLRFQLPLYLEAYRSRHPDSKDWDAAYYSLSTQRGIRPHMGRSKSKNCAAPFDRIAERLSLIASAISAGTFPLTLLEEKVAGCVSCAFRSVCRTGAVRLERRRDALSTEKNVPVYLPEFSEGETASVKGSAGESA